MTTIAARRTHVPFWPAVGLAVVGWLIAWFITLPLANWVAYDLLGLQEGSQLGDAIAFFLYDVPKVLLLLTGIVTLVSFLRSYVSPERVRSALAGRGVLPGTMAAAGFGVVTPFCSCSAVPLFIGFVEVGVPLGVTFAFLIASPMVNEIAIVLLWGLFGPVVTAIYIAAGLLVAVVAGLVIGRLHLERYVEPYVWQIKAGGTTAIEMKLTLEDRVRDAWTSTRSLVWKVHAVRADRHRHRRRHPRLRPDRPRGLDRRQRQPARRARRSSCSASRSTATPRAPSRSSRCSSPRACRWARPSPS